MNPRIPDLRIEQYVLGELTPEQAAEVETALGPELPTRLAALSIDGEDLLRRYPPRVMAGRLQTSTRRARMHGRASVLVLVGAVAAAALVSLRPDELPSQPELAAADGDIAKGLSATLVAHRQVGSGSEPLEDGDLAQAGDRLQLSTVVTEPLYGMVLSVDGRGTVTFHAGRHGAVALDPGGPVQLAQSYLLDDAPRYERFFLVTSAEPFSAERVEAAARALHDSDDPLDLPAELDQTSLTVVKP